jgi:hypothetical protein
MSLLAHGKHSMLYLPTADRQTPRTFSSMSLLLRPDSHTVYTQEQRLEQQLINDQSLAQQQQQMRAVQQQPPKQPAAAAAIYYQVDTCGVQQGFVARNHWW